MSAPPPQKRARIAPQQREASFTQLLTRSPCSALRAYLAASDSLEIATCSLLTSVRAHDLARTHVVLEHVRERLAAARYDERPRETTADATTPDTTIGTTNEWLAVLACALDAAARSNDGEAMRALLDTHAHELADARAHALHTALHAGSLDVVAAYIAANAVPDMHAALALAIDDDVRTLLASAYTRAERV